MSNWLLFNLQQAGHEGEATPVGPAAALPAGHNFIYIRGGVVNSQIMITIVIVDIKETKNIC